MSKGTAVIFRKRCIPALLLVLLLLLSGCFSDSGSAPLETEEAPLTVTVIDVGNADSILIAREGVGVLIDAGNNGDGGLVLDVIHSNGLERLAYVIGTHPHEDHIGGLDEVLREIPADAILLPDYDADTKTYRDLLDAIPVTTERINAKAELSYSLGGFRMDVLGPVRVYDDANNNSVVVKITYGDTAFLFTGDIEAEAERDLIDYGADISCDVLKAAHHGSNTSSSYLFLRQSNPKEIVISCGEGNSYGHPHEEPLFRYRDLGATVYRTDLLGSIVFRSDGKDIAADSEGQKSDRPHTTEGGLGADVSVAEYIGNVNSKKFHLPECKSLPAEKNRILFNSRKAAEDAGYSPCGSCKP